MTDTERVMMVHDSVLGHDTTSGRWSESMLLVQSCYAPMSFGKYDMELQVSVPRAEWLKRIVFRFAALAESQQDVEL